MAREFGIDTSPRMLIQERVAEIKTLKSGSHANMDAGMCAMEAASYIAGEPWSDHPQCVCPVLGAFMRAWNDSLPSDAERLRLLPLIPKLIGTRGSAALESRRATMACDWLVRVNTPAWLRLANLDTQAAAIEALPEIIDFEKCPRLMPALEAALSPSAAARDAARAAARDAAGAKVKTTIEMLQHSAVSLVERMISVEVPMNFTVEGVMGQDATA